MSTNGINPRTTSISITDANGAPLKIASIQTEDGILSITYDNGVTVHNAPDELLEALTYAYLDEYEDEHASADADAADQ